MAQGIVRYTEIKAAEVCRYDAVALGEVMLRFDSFDVPTARSRQMRVFQGGNGGAAHGILVQETPGDITMVDEKAVLAEVKRAHACGGVKATR